MIINIEEIMFFAYFQSSAILFIRHFIDWTLWFATKGTLSTKILPANKVARIISVSTAVLDVEHPSQTGLTSRTIDTLLSGKKLITTNQQIYNNLYHPSRVHVIDRYNPSIPEDFRNTL